MAVDTSITSFSYPGASAPALADVSFSVEPGEVVLLLGVSGSGKTTLLRALAGLVPHFHGGRFEGRVVTTGLDTRRVRPAALAGRVATVFQDPEDQVVFTRVEREVAFGLENLGVAPGAILARARAALAAVGAEHLAERRTAELSSGELQRICLASALALEPDLLLLDEPTSQLDPEGATGFLERALTSGCAVVISEQRPDRVIDRVDRIVFMECGRIVVDAPRDHALEQLPDAWLAREPDEPSGARPGDPVCRVDDVSFAYTPGVPALERASLELLRGEVVALLGRNGIGKTTLGKLAAGLLEPQSGRIERGGRAAFLLQDPGRYMLRERAEEEVALGVGGDRASARRALAQVGLAGREAAHPRDLSSGERERLALASVLVTEPDLLVLDEPTRGVDPERKRELASLLRREATTRATLVITHDVLFARTVADRVVELGASDREAVLA
jgi:energy-coupling factor transporter ATP-binding protein EcfA2